MGSHLQSWIQQPKLGCSTIHVDIFFFLSSIEQHSVLKELIHDLDVWHKSAKLVKALTEVSNTFPGFASDMR